MNSTFKSICILGPLYCLATLACFSGTEAPEGGQIRFVEFITGSWKCRTTDLDGRLLYEPNVASFESILNGKACCETIRGQTKLVTVYQPGLANTIVKVDIHSMPPPHGAKTIVLVGKFNEASRTISWSDGDGKLVHTWRIVDHDTITVELPPSTGGKDRDQLMLWTRIPLRDRQNDTDDKGIHDSRPDDKPHDGSDRLGPRTSGTPQK